MIGAILFIGAVSTNASIVSINDVQVVPELPSLNDIITVEVSGGFAQMGPTFDESMFNQNVFSLELDLFFTAGFGPTIPVMWSHDEVIGTLLPGTYDLLAQAYLRNSPDSDYILNDFYFTNIEVVPEPATFLLLGLGGLILRS
jgi:hypothetical protein